MVLFIAIVISIFITYQLFRWLAFSIVVKRYVCTRRFACVSIGFTVATTNRIVFRIACFGYYLA